MMTPRLLFLLLYIAAALAAQNKMVFSILLGITDRQIHPLGWLGTCLLGENHFRRTMAL